MQDFSVKRQRMVTTQIASRGIEDAAVLHAMGVVPREKFLPIRLAEFAYQDTPLPIEAGQTISQPYIVALMIECVEAKPGEKALEIGTGSGYAAAVLSRIADSVYTVERHEELAAIARQRFAELHFDNIHVLTADGTLGWPEHAPYDVIIVTAGGPQIPKPLLEQLRVGGRLVIPVGSSSSRAQQLIRVTRVTEDQYDEENLGDVQFVPLIGAEGWADASGRAPARASRPQSVAKLIREVAEPIGDIGEVDLSALVERIGDARVVLLGEATHGTSEFYQMRARISRRRK